MPTEVDKITKWKCDHCDKEFDDKRDANVHEAICTNNIANHGCGTCKYPAAKKPCALPKGIVGPLDIADRVYCSVWKDPNPPKVAKVDVLPSAKKSNPGDKPKRS